MKAYASFRERALHESLRYGDDPYVFLRELVQNARDAGAREVNVAVTVEGGRTRIVFDDDGSGMTFKHAKSFLFRLYASSKENEDDSAGHFGVGFWSVLRWAPESLRIESRSGASEQWGVELDASLSRVTDVTCALSSLGTRITLERATREDDLPALALTVRERLSYYCRYVRVRGGKARLALVCNGERVDRELDVASVMEGSGSEATLAMSFASAGASGIVALAATPKVLLYARGLLVSESTVLDELDGATSGRRDAIGSSGLAPVVVLNSERLDVVLSRRKARDSRELRRLMRLARARLDRLVSHAVDGVVERSVFDRLSDMASEGVRALGGGLAVAVLVVWLLVIAAGALAALVLWRVPQGGVGERTVITVVRGSTATTPDAAAESPQVPVGSIDPSALAGATRPVGNIVGYGGAIVDVPDSYGPAWSFGYRGPSRVFFKALTLDEYDASHGFVRRELPVTGPYPGPSIPGCGRGSRACIDVVTQVVANDAPFVLPVPTGYGVVDHSVTIDGTPQELATNTLGEALLQLDAGRRGTLRYQVTPVTASPAEAIAIPTLTFGEPWDGLLARAVRLPVPRRVELVTGFVRDTIRYDVTPMTAAMFAHAHGDWHDRVLAVGAGDCDVKNGLNALLLRQLGVDARLAIGIAGEDGMARPSLHAWTEYFANGRWHVIDATGQPAAFDVAAERAKELAMRRNADPAVVAVGVPSAADAPVRRRAAPSERRSRVTPDISSRAEPPHTAPLAETIAAAQPSVAVEPVPVTPTGAVAPSRPETPVRERHAIARRAAELTDRLFAATTRVPTPLVYALLVGIPALISVVMLSRSRVRERLVNEGPEDAKREALAKMVHDMLTQPHAWRGIGRAWHQRLLPVLAGRPMSLEEALRRARDNVLFVSRSRGNLADMAASCGTPVLDAADPFFGKVVVPLLRTVDLDSIEPLLEGGGEGTGPYTGLARANAVLAAAKADVRFVLAEALHDAPLRDVDLTRVQLPKKLGAPRRFIAVSPSHREVRARLDKLERDPDRGVFIWLDWSVERSELLAEHVSDVRQRAAAYAVDVLGGAER